MTFSGHFAVCALILTVTQQPVLAVVLCLLGHYVLDALPHAEWTVGRHASPLARATVALDCLATIALAYSIFLSVPGHPLLVACALLASILPDLTDAFARKYARPLRRFHEYLHTWPQPIQHPVDWSKTATGNVAYPVKVAMQVVLVAGVQLYLGLRLLG